jgi:hypothetical protein
MGCTTEDSSFVGNDAMSVVGNLESQTLKMEAASSFEMSDTVYQSTWCHIPEDLYLYPCCHENVNSWIGSLLVIDKFDFCS